MIDPITYLAMLLGVSPVRVAMYLPLIILVSNWLSRLIPDTATGWKGVARSILKVVGLYASSRVAPGLTVSDISKMVIQPPLDGKMIGKITEHAIDQTMAEAVPDQPVIRNNPFKRRPDGRAIPTEDGFVRKDLLAILMICMIVPFLAGCTTFAARPTISYVCKNRETIRAYVDALADKLNICPILDNEVR